jgi:thioesterase domain-containing protein
MFVCKTPETTKEFEQYYQLRWQLLRAPWQQAKGSEQDDIEAQSCHRMLINKQGEPVAVVRFHFTDQYNVQVRYMAVAKQMQGKGLGQQLMLQIEQQAVKQGAKQITLNARENALPFYQQLGYQNLGFHHQLYDEINHFAMQKQLPKHLDEAQQQAIELTKLWHNTIPMSKAMNLAICYYDKQQLISHCDPAFNQNLHHTMFAGSIYTLATLTGWGWVYLQLQQRQLVGDIVLADAQIKYKKPIKGPARAELSQDDCIGDLASITHQRKAKISVTCKIYCGDLVCAIFTGSYAVIPSKK